MRSKDDARGAYVKAWSLRGLGRHGRGVRVLRRAAEREGEGEWKVRLERMMGEEEYRVEKGVRRDRVLAKKVGKMVQGVMNEAKEV